MPLADSNPSKRQEVWVVVNRHTGIVVGCYREYFEAQEHIRKVNERYPFDPDALVIEPESE